MAALVVSGLLLAGLGIVAMVAPDLIWAWTERRNEAMGVASERGPRWETGNKIGGAMGIVAGVVLVIVGFGS